MKTFVLTVVVEDEKFVNSSVESAARELLEMVQESIEPSDMIVDEVVCIEENSIFHAELMRTE